MHKQVSLARVMVSRPALLTILWSLGMCGGLISGYPIRHLLGRYYYGSCLADIRFINLFISAGLPFVFATVLGVLNRPHLLYVLVFFVSYFDGISYFPLWSAFGSASWLVGWMLFFSRRFTMPLFIWYCLRRLSQKAETIGNLAISYFGTLLICLFDYYLIAPQLLLMMNTL